MLSNNQKTNLNKLIEDFNFLSSKKYKLIVLLGLLGDFDSFGWIECYYFQRADCNEKLAIKQSKAME